jgi:molybdopterin converting factor subunit 1
MKITVRLFAIVRELAGVDQLVLDLPAGSAVEAALAELADRLPEAREQIGRAAIAVNRIYARPAAMLNDGDELAIIPPVSGG